jgi:CPA2 family monovalent cation:H+ antiporter-2
VGYDAGAIIILILIYIVIAIFAVPMMRNRSRAFTNLWLEKLSNRPPLVVMTIIKMLVIEFIAVLPLLFTYEFDHILILVLIPLSVFVFARSNFIASYYLRLETRFFANLNQKTMDARGGARSEQNWLDEDYSIFSWIVPQGASYAGRSLADLHWGRNYSVYVVKLGRGEKRMPMPPGRSVIHEGDKIHVIGERHSLETFYKTLETDQQIDIRTLREFLEAGYPDEKDALACAAIMVRGTESYAGKPIRKSGIVHRNNCMILGLERDGYAIKMPPSNMIILKGDILWIVGTRSSLGSIATHSVGKAGSHEDGGLYDSKDSGEESRSEGEMK